MWYECYTKGMYKDLLDKDATNFSHTKNGSWLGRISKEVRTGAWLIKRNLASEGQQGILSKAVELVF